MVEFTGERVIPGQVNEDLWNEHLARYAFARRYANGKRVLDAGCGTGYGAAELALSASSVTGVDLDPEAIAFAREHYQSPALRFLASTCTAMPFPNHEFDVIVAFEVIEHLADYRAFLDECARVLRPPGLVIVSSPNRRYYAETRAKTGPNPYHQHEFEADEFVRELGRLFPGVRLLLQNRVESFAFHSALSASEAEAFIGSSDANPEDAHFLIALCSLEAIPEPEAFVYVPKAANLLREREHHVALLEQELDRAKQWLADTQTERDRMIELFREQKEQLEERNRWAAQLGSELTRAGERIVALQNELEKVRSGYESKVLELKEDDRKKTEWALTTSRALDAKSEELAECVRLLETAEATVIERTHWAQKVEAQRQELAAELNRVHASRWLKLGRILRLGPRLISPEIAPEVRTLLTIFWRLVKLVPVLILSPILLLVAACGMAAVDLAGASRKKRLPANRRPATTSASVVIPNWNGRDLLEKYLPSVVEALRGDPANEIVVVDNGSSDGSAQFLRDHFPSIRVLALDRNLGFGGGSNAGFRAAKNDIVVLLNSDMRVEPDFLAPLLEAFTDENVFSVACQIFFSDPNKLREETGLTQGWWENGGLRVRHRADANVQIPYPCFYGGGGSCAFDRSKFLELGGFDELLRPFYLEDTDLGYLAWKRGWKVLYQPRSVVYHEHRGTIGKHFSKSRIDRVLKKNFILFRVEEHSRVAPPGLPFLLHLCGRGSWHSVRRLTGARQFQRTLAGFRAIAGCARIAREGDCDGHGQRYRSVRIDRWPDISAIALP